MDDHLASPTFSLDHVDASSPIPRLSAALKTHTSNLSELGPELGPEPEPEPEPDSKQWRALTWI